MDIKNVGMIGLGLMGTALTERLLQAGYTVWVHNRTREKAQPLVALGAHWSDNPLAVCDRVLISLYTTDTVEEMLERLGDGLRASQILIDTTTGEPEQTAPWEPGWRLAGCSTWTPRSRVPASRRARRSDCNRRRTAQAFDACDDLFRCCVAKTLYAGPCGSGAKMKLVSNLVLGLNRAALAEGLVFAQALALDTEAALGVLIGTMAYSRIMDTKGRKMIEGDFRTQARLSQHLKDIRLILTAAAEAGQALPLTETHRQLLEAAEAAGFGDADNSAVIRAFARPTHQPSCTQAFTPDGDPS